MANSVSSDVTNRVVLSVDELMVEDVVKEPIGSVLSEALEVVAVEKILPRSPVEVPFNTVLNTAGNELVVGFVEVKPRLALLLNVGEDVSIWKLETVVVVILASLVAIVTSAELAPSTVVLVIGVVVGSFVVEVVF